MEVVHRDTAEPRDGAGDAIYFQGGAGEHRINVSAVRSFRS